MSAPFSLIGVARVRDADGARRDEERAEGGHTEVGGAAREGGNSSDEVTRWCRTNAAAATGAATQQAPNHVQKP